MWYSGIDLHKRTIALHTLDADGTVVRQTQIAARPEVLAAYFATLPGPHQAVVDCTGMWYWVRDLLAAQGIDLRLGHAKYLKAISYAQGQDRCSRRRDPRPTAPGGADSRGAHGAGGDP